MESRILKDEREIDKLLYNNDFDEQWVASEDIKIKAYGEPREYCHVAFFEVEKDGVVVSRLPATMVEVLYK